MKEGVIDKNDVRDAGVTHFPNIENSGQTLEFGVGSEDKYADLVSEGEGFTVSLGLCSNKVSAVDLAFLVYKTNDCKYLRKGTLEYLPGLASSTSARV